MTPPRLDEGSEREEAPPNNLPDWGECAMRVANSEFIAKRVAEGGYGPEADSKLATELHRFIYEYDDADRYRSAWFMHRLELLLEETRRAALSTGRLGGEVLVINATQLRSALELVAPDFDTDEDQREQEVVIQRLPARTSTDGEPMEAGLYCWLADYPEEGCIPLREDEAFPAPAAQSQGDSNDR